MWCHPKIHFVSTKYSCQHLAQRTAMQGMMCRQSPRPTKTIHFDTMYKRMQLMLSHMCRPRSFHRKLMHQWSTFHLHKFHKNKHQNPTGTCQVDREKG